MKVGDQHKDLIAAMRRHGVLLRDRSADPGCQGCVRITIGIEDHVTKGLAAMKASLAEIGWIGPANDDASEDVREYE